MGRGGRAFLVLFVAYGALFAFGVFFAALCPLLAGATYDATGSDAPVCAASAGLNVVAIALLRLCRPPRLRSEGIATPDHELSTAGDAAPALEPGRMSH